MSHDRVGGCRVAGGRVAGGRGRDEHGMVTAETAVALPVLVAVTLAMVWLLTLGVAQMKVTDAAREAARALARGESAERAVELAEQAAPGASVTVEAEEGTVVVTVRQDLSPPGGVLSGAFGAAEVRSSATALDEVP
jgi:Flp pilus assembly protein TadG